MDDETRELLEGEIAVGLNNLSNLKLGSDEYLKGAEAICKLNKSLSDTLNDEAKFHEQMIKEDIDQKREKADKRDRIIGWAFKAAEIAIPTIVYITVTKWGFKFEQDGTFTSRTFSGFFNRMKPKGLK